MLWLLLLACTHAAATAPSIETHTGGVQAPWAAADQARLSIESSRAPGVQGSYFHTQVNTERAPGTLTECKWQAHVLQRIDRRPASSLDTIKHDHLQAGSEQAPNCEQADTLCLVSQAVAATRGRPCCSRCLVHRGSAATNAARPESQPRARGLSGNDRRPCFCTRTGSSSPPVSPHCAEAAARRFRSVCIWQ